VEIRVKVMLALFFIENIKRKWCQHFIDTNILIIFTERILSQYFNMAIFLTICFMDVFSFHIVI